MCHLVSHFDIFYAVKHFVASVLFPVAPFFHLIDSAVFFFPNPTSILYPSALDFHPVNL